MIPILDLKPEINEIRDEIDDAIRQVIDNTAFIMGPDVKAFEEEAAGYLGSKHAIGVNSGTDALVIGMRALGIGPGDEVITTPFSFFATAESIGILGAEPVFVDIEEKSFNLDPNKVEAAITGRTKAILPVHLYGRPTAMGAIMEIAGRHDLLVVEDCAQSFGARYEAGTFDSAAFSDSSPSPANNLNRTIDGRQTGTIGDVGAFSFFPTKNLGGFGDGGLIVTDNDEAAEIARMLRVHGANKKYHNETLGYNSRLDSIQAAVLRVKLKHIDRWNRGRLEAARRYNELFSDVETIQTPEAPDGHVFHQYTIRITDGDRDPIRQQLKDAGIATMVYYPVPQDRLPIYEGTFDKFEVSDRLSREVLSLPIWPSIDEETQQKVVDEIKNHV